MKWSTDLMSKKNIQMALDGTNRAIEIMKLKADLMESAEGEPELKRTLELLDEWHGLLLRKKDLEAQLNSVV